MCCGVFLHEEHDGEGTRYHFESLSRSSLGTVDCAPGAGAVAVTFSRLEASKDFERGGVKNDFRTFRPRKRSICPRASFGLVSILLVLDLAGCCWFGLVLQR